MNYQYQSSNGQWIACSSEQADKFINMAVEYDNSRPAEWRDGISSIEIALTILENGKTLKFGPDWYWNIRKQLQPQPQPQPQEYRLDCGCTVYHRDHIMTSANGTTCTDCYDRMSN